jgi:serine/threonine protein kinase
VKCATCHSEYDEGTSHHCPLKSSALGSWGSAPAATAAPAPPKVQPSAPPQPAPSQSAPAAPVAPSSPPPAAPTNGDGGFDMRPHQFFDNPVPEIAAGAPVKAPEAPRMVLEIASPRRNPNETEKDLMEESLDLRFHVEKQEDPNIGKVIGERYKIISLVGRGGMGMVYRADHVMIDRPVAIKMLYPNTVADAEAVKRFKQEAQAVSKVEHSHSVRIFDFGMSDLGQPYIVMDFIDGHSLRELIKDEPLPIGRAEDIFTQVIDALACAHRAGVIHRDLKPENIMLSPRSNKQDWVSVVDFGISSLGADEHVMQSSSQRTELRGSPPYMSPEQCSKNANIDHRSDIYSLAIVLYEALTGRLPYNARNAFEWVEQHISGKPLPLTQATPALAACETLSGLILKALEKNPDKRPQTIEEFGVELKEAVRRDHIHLGYLKNRKDALGGSSSKIPVIEAAEFSTPASYDDQLITGRQKHLTAEQAGEDGPKGVWQALVTTFSAIPALKDSDIANHEAAKFVFTSCPHCGESVEPHVAFCLGCGRTLASSQDFSKVRAAQGVFTLPSGNTLSAPVPAFSQKTKTKGGLATMMQSANKALLLVSLILAICIFAYAGGVEWIAKAIHNSSASKHE